MMPRLFRCCIRYGFSALAIVLFVLGVTGIHVDQHHGDPHLDHAHVFGEFAEAAGHAAQDEGPLAGHGHVHGHDQLHAVIAWSDALLDLRLSPRESRALPRNQTVPESLLREPDVPPVIA